LIEKSLFGERQLVDLFDRSENVDTWPLMHPLRGRRLPLKNVLAYQTAGRSGARRCVKWQLSIKNLGFYDGSTELAPVVWTVSAFR